MAATYLRDARIVPPFKESLVEERASRDVGS